MRKGTKMAPTRPVAVRDRKNKAIGVLSRLSSWRESVFEVGDSLSSCFRRVSDV
jgi:hypothetical protein